MTGKLIGATDGCPAWPSFFRKGFRVSVSGTTRGETTGGETTGGDIVGGDATGGDTMDGEDSVWIVGIGGIAGCACGDETSFLSSS